MTPSFANAGAFRQHFNGSGEWDSLPPNGKKTIFLVALQRDLLAPFLPGNSPLQHMRVVVVDPDGASDPYTFDAMNGAFVQPVPPMREAPPMRGNLMAHPRAVQGQILRDETGRLYERIGQTIRALHRVVATPYGQIVDLLPPPRETDSRDSSGFEPPDLADARADLRGKVRENSRGQAQMEPEDDDRSSRTQRPGSTPFRKLFPDPGTWRLVRFGDFREILAPQLAHPEQLRDAHRLACLVQIYEAGAAMRLEALSEAILHDQQDRTQIRPLKADAAAKLQVRVPARMARTLQREAGLILPYERVFRLQVAQDPTADSAAPKPEQAQKCSVAEVKSDPATSPSTEPQTTSAAPKNSIPERFMKPWEFQHSREEVLYDINVTEKFSGFVVSFLRRFKSWAMSQGGFRKWKVLLYGKDLEEQLWAIRPPKGRMSMPAIREWARQTLELAGYDPRTMLLEWEIFWRRKGL